MTNAYDRPYPEQSQAVLVLVLGIIGLVMCQLTAPVAWALGRSERQAVAEGRRPPENLGLADAGRVLGIIGTILLCIGLLVLVVILVFGLTTLSVNSGPA